MGQVRNAPDQAHRDEKRVNPAVALALGVTLLGEPFTIGAVVGFALILVGLFLSTTRARAASESIEKADDVVVEAR